MSTARWEHRTPDVPISRVNVMHGGSGFHIQLGEEVLWVSSRAHWEDIAEEIAAGFADLAPARPVPLPRTDGVKANVAGACWGEDE